MDFNLGFLIDIINISFSIFTSGFAKVLVFFKKVNRCKDWDLIFYKTSKEKFCSYLFDRLIFKFFNNFFKKVNCGKRSSSSKREYFFLLTNDSLATELLTIVYFHKTNFELLLFFWVLCTKVPLNAIAMLFPLLSFLLICFTCDFFFLHFAISIHFVNSIECFLLSNMYLNYLYQSCIKINF